MKVPQCLHDELVGFRVSKTKRDPYGRLFLLPTRQLEDAHFAHLHAGVYDCDCFERALVHDYGKVCVALAHHEAVFLHLFLEHRRRNHEEWWMQWMHHDHGNQYASCILCTGGRGTGDFYPIDNTISFPLWTEEGIHDLVLHLEYGHNVHPPKEAERP